jgi:MarR family transcriptional regulator for hemolysin
MSTSNFMSPEDSPIGLVLAKAAKGCGRAFEDALAAAGGSTPVWLILLALVQGPHRTQTEVAAAVGIQGPTLTHHLNNMERDGLIERTRLPENRRVHQVSLTSSGRDLFNRLRQAAMTHDARVREGFTPEELSVLRGLLLRLSANVPDVQLL